MSLVELGIMGFIIGLTGALAPGPTLIATIQSSIRTGWKSGPLVTGGHIIVELLVVILIMVGIPLLPSGSSVVVAIIGGTALFVFGVLTLHSSRTASLTLPSGSPLSQSPLIAGLITSLSNPYFWIWWFSVGSALILSSLTNGFAGLVVFMCGHWLSDLSWFTLVSTSVHKSRAVFRDQEYKIILFGCGVLLIAFGLWFIITGIFYHI